MSVLPVGIGNSGGEYTIEESLRFNASQSSYLSWTPASAGNRKTWTWSAWVKKSNATTSGTLFAARTGAGATYLTVVMSSVGDFRMESNSETAYPLYKTNALFRDPSAWYHFVVALDMTQATSTNRLKVWVNGVLQTTASYNVPAQNTDLTVNSTEAHLIGQQASGSYFDGYLTEINFIDGQALTPSDFGEYDADTGVWKPKAYTGTYGTNGFYLPMQLDNTTEGFNTVTYRGNGATQQISGVGFSPDLVWVKNRGSGNHFLADTVRGVTKALLSDATLAEVTDANYIKSFNTDGFTVGSDTGYNTNGASYVGWCWDAGNSTVSNTDGTITSSVRANPTYGFSIVSFTGTGANGSVGHGLTNTPKVIISKRRDTGPSSWVIAFDYSGFTWSSDYFQFDTGAKRTDGASTVWRQAPTSSVFSIGSNFANTGTYIAYCFSEVAGYSKFGSYTGTGASGNAVTTGFKPAFVMIKRSDSADEWAMHDSTRDTDGNVNTRLIANSSGAELTTQSVVFTDTGFTVDSTSSSHNASGGTYIYMAFKDTREYAYWLDDSGNNNDWQPNGGITTQSSVTDVPTLTSETAANYAVLNPLDRNGTYGSVTNGNLTQSVSTANHAVVFNSMAMPSGKTYLEVTSGTTTSATPLLIAFGLATQSASRTGYGNTNTWSIKCLDVRTLWNGASSSSNFGSAFTSGTTLQLAYDSATGYMWIGDGTNWYNSTGGTTGSPSAGTNPSFTISTTESLFFFMDCYAGSGTVTAHANFGQRPFAYTPPTGFKALNTFNLPDSTIVDGGEYFNAVLYTGNGSTNNVTGVGFQPDFVWLKARSAGGFDHVLQDVIRGSTRQLYTNTTDAEVDDTDAVTSFNVDGFTSGADVTTNNSGTTYVAWNWKAGGTAVSNTDGSITSSVSANTTSGFSIVTYTGTGATSSSVTIGHGLGATPAFIITKKRYSGTDYGWSCWHKDLGGNYGIWLNSTSARNINMWSGYSNISSTVFSPPDLLYGNESGQAYVNYLFADVPGFSKFGKYTGNGSSDGPFVFCGFRPRFIMTKRTDSTSDWHILDTSRNTYNVAGSALFPNSSSSETSSGWYDRDFLSNGFKIRASVTDVNANGGTYIFAAFAENPFKNSLAR